MTWTSLIGCTVLFLFLEAFFSGSELALVTADKLKLTHRAARGNRGAKIAIWLARRPAWLFSATLLGQNLFIVGNSILITFFIFNHYGPEYEFYGILLSPLVLIFGEAVPKSLCQQYADRLVGYVAPVILVFSYLLFPIVWPFSKLTLLLLGGVQGSLLEGHDVTRESLEILFKESEIPRGISPVFKKSLLKILAFARKFAFEIMTPLIHVFCVRDTTTVGEAIFLCQEEGYSSIPVFHKRTYNIVGVVNYFDMLLAKDLQAPVSEMMEEPFFVPNVMGVKDLFLHLRDEKKSFSIVVDEYGGAVGIVTLEDILEEIVGEIEDEFDEQKVSWKMVGPAQYLFDGRVPVDEINEKLRWGLPKESGGETLAGFLLARFGRIPKTGDVLHYGSLTFLIKAATPRSIEEILVEFE